MGFFEKIKNLSWLEIKLLGGLEYYRDIVDIGFDKYSFFCDIKRDIITHASRRGELVSYKYLSIYENYISYLSEIFDDEIIKNIKVIIKDNSMSLINTLRNEIDVKVTFNLCKHLLSDSSYTKIRGYCDRVYTDADNNLLDLLQEAIEDTNDYISKCIVKYNEDKALALAKHKKSLINLTADDESNAKELKQIAEELAVAEFIANEATPIQ